MAGGIKLQDAATTGNGSAVDCKGEGGEYSFSLETSNATVAGGSVQFEEAASPSYAGTWSPIGPAITPVQNGVQTVKVTGAFNAVRARIATNITGGATVTARVQPPLLGFN